MNTKNKVRKVVRVVSASVMIMLMLSVVCVPANGGNTPGSTYYLRKILVEEMFYKKEIVKVKLPASQEHPQTPSGEFVLGPLPNEYEGEFTVVTHVDIPNGYNSIKAEAFKDCSELESITIPASVKSIGRGAFNGCFRLTNITIPGSSVTNISKEAFRGCSRLTNITIPASVESIGPGAFRESGLTQVNIPGNVKSICTETFCGCSRLTRVNLRDGLVSISGGAFKGCSSLTNITIPGSVTNISKEVFKGCSSLTNIMIPGNIKNIAIDAFTGCPSVEELELTGTGNDELSVELKAALKYYYTQEESTRRVVSRNPHWANRNIDAKTIELKTD